MDFVVKSVVMWVPRGAAGSTTCEEGKSPSQSSPDFAAARFPDCLFNVVFVAQM